MIVGVPKETFPGEHRVALVPAVVPALTLAGLTVVVEQEAGEAAGLSDASYQGKGARLAAHRAELFSKADVVLQVRGLGANPEAGASDLELLKRGQVLVGLQEPLTGLEEVRMLAQRGVTAFALELMPRIARAQAMDALTSQATVAGYRAVLLAAGALPKMFPMMITAAGTVAPARLLVVGAGVAGLQAVATARRLGAVASAYDVRPEVKEQVVSLGARFVELPLEATDTEEAGGYARAMGDAFYRRQQELMASVVAESDVVITTAMVVGRRAPVLITEAMVRGMKPGSVIVDVAAERGGNCELTSPGRTVTAHGVTILGPLNLPSDVPSDASLMYAKNISAFLLPMVKDGALVLDTEDDIVRETMVLREGEVVNPKVRELLGLPTLAGA